MNSVTQGSRWAYGLLTLACLVLGASGIFAMSQESSAFLRSGPIIDRAKLVEPTMSVGLSADSMRTVLNDCNGAMQRYRSLDMIYQGAETRDNIVRNCFETADHIAAQSPTLSIAWYTGAFAAALLGDKPAFNERLQRSQLTAPNEQWIVDIRVDLAENYLADLDSLSLVAHEKDLQLMVRSALGLRNVARRWIRDEGFRARIADIVEIMPQDVQRRFVTNLQRAVRNAGR